MAAVRDALRRAAAGLALLAWFLLPAPAPAATTSFAVGEQSVVHVLAGNLSTVTIRAWDRPTVQIDTDDEGLQVTRNALNFGTARNPLSAQIPVARLVLRDAASGSSGSASLPPEDFPYASDFHAGVHDTARIVVGARAHITVMIPSTTAILDARIRGSGVLSIDDYRGGTLFVGNGGGRTTLSDITSAAFVQVMNGRLDVRDSSFDRLRARGNTASFVFDRTRARQIEVTTVSGPIIYDNGTFDPGLARFESTTGAIAIGVAAGAQLQGRATDGRVLGLWDRRTPTDQRAEGEASATVAGGGPVVNAVTGRGNVYFYDGSLDSRRDVPADWRALKLTMRGRTPLAPATYQRPASYQRQANDPRPPASYQRPPASYQRPADPNAPPGAFERFRDLRNRRN